MRFVPIGAPGSFARPAAIFNAAAFTPTLIMQPRLQGFGQVEEGGVALSIPPALLWSYRILGIAGTALGGYHGYKRNAAKHPIWGALLWGFLGGVFPVITIPIALAQGYAKPKRRK